MGSMNFGNNFYEALGFVPETYVSAEAVAEYRASYLTDCENNPASDEYVTDDEVKSLICDDEAELVSEYAAATTKLVETLNDFMRNNRVNPLFKFGGTMLIKFELEYGYHDGFRVVIENVCLDRHERYTLGEYYDQHHYTGNGWIFPQYLPIGMTYLDFAACHDKTEAWAQYVLRELSHILPLHGVDGGSWTSGSYTMRENTRAEHDRFADEFAILLKEIKALGLCYL